MKDFHSLVDRLVRTSAFAESVAHYQYLPAQPPVFEELDDTCPEPLRRAVAAAGIQKIYSHQAQALRQLRQGQHTGVTTPTASGKTLIYNLAVGERLLADPEARALYLFPLKALAQDQLKTLNAFFEQVGDPSLSAAVYDGDTPPAARGRIKRRLPRVLFTNPDMLHYGLLAYPEAWRQFFRQLRFVVIDEAHTYRGIFGSHVSQILRRLRRLCGEPGPTFVASSATMANAREFLENLSGLPFSVIEQSGAPRQGRHVILLDPKGSPYAEAAAVLQECLEHNVKTILFTKSRKIAELIQIWVREASPRHGERIAAYRAGYLPEERRRIEQRLFRDELAAVISTSALESGIDVGGLDAAVLVGYPGTMISTWQRVGRAGRQQRDALMVLIALPDALDHYFLRHPEVFLAGKFENCVLDPENIFVLRQHLPCAAKEQPLVAADAAVLGSAALAEAPGLTASGDLQEAGEGNQWFCSRKHPHRLLDIRSVGDGFAIKLERNGDLLGSIDESRVFKECHQGAVYLHAGQQYEVIGLDFDRRTVLVKASDADWYTQYTSSEEVEILGLAPNERVEGSTGRFQAGVVRVRVTEKIVSYERRRVRDQSLLSEHKLNLPPRVFETQAMLLTVPESWRKRSLEFGLDFAGGLHAAEHLLIASLPVHVLCDRWDLGGLSTLAHPQVTQPCLFIYDGFPGGVGLAAKGREVLAEWLGTAHEMISRCECEEGCPACIHSPKCGSRNQPLDKQACQMLLAAASRETVGDWRVSKSGILQSSAPESGPPVLNQPEPVSPEPLAAARPFHLVVFDVETQRSAAEVGGWDRADLMGLSLAVAYDHSTGAYTTYREEQAGALIQHLLSADLVVGFNINQFDLTVLKPYGKFLERIKTLDIAQEVRQTLGHRLSLEHLGRATLNQGKTAEGLQAIAWFREGRWDLLEQYCRADVELTRNLFFFGLKYGYLLFERQGVILKIPVTWQERLPQLALAAPG
ncbi:MAG: DEAD/DEAH box helicase [candidate division FCPU426 bacterium]